MRTTLETLLSTYEGLSGSSTPPLLRKIYGKRLSRIHTLSNQLVEHDICSRQQAQLLLYQLVIHKLGWRRAKRHIYATERLASDDPSRAQESYEALYNTLCEIVAASSSQEVLQ